jgi:hypothetical protein
VVASNRVEPPTRVSDGGASLHRSQEDIVGRIRRLFRISQDRVAAPEDRFPVKLIPMAELIVVKLG